MQDRKTRRRLIPNSKGFSSIVGAVFAVLVMISLISTVFVWSLSQNTLYNNAVKQSNLADLDRSNERIVTNVTCYRNGDNSVLVNGTLENDGPLSAQIVTLWVVDANTTNYNHTALNIVLTPGNITTLSGITAINVALKNQQDDSLHCWFISARGNTISEKSNTIIINEGGGASTEIPPFAYTSGGIGSLAFDFGSLTYFNVSGNTITPYPSGAPAYNVPGLWNLAFGFNITNYNLNKYNITLAGGNGGGTFMWSYFAGVPGHQLGPVWFLVRNQTNTIQTTYSPITLEYNVTKFLVFALQTQSFDNAQKGSVGAINLVFYGNFTTTSNGSTSVKGNYGQNVPFVTIYFS